MPAVVIFDLETIPDLAAVARVHGIDSGNDDLFNHILWYAMKGNQPYPDKFAGKDED